MAFVIRSTTARYLNAQGWEPVWGPFTTAQVFPDRTTAMTCYEAALERVAEEHGPDAAAAHNGAEIVELTVNVW